MTKEQRDEYIKNIIHERDELKRRLIGEEARDHPRAAKTRQRIADCNEQLALMGESAEPRNKVRK